MAENETKENDLSSGKEDNQEAQIPMDIVEQEEIGNKDKPPVDIIVMDKIIPKISTGLLTSIENHEDADSIKISENGNVKNLIEEITIEDDDTNVTASSTSEIVTLTDKVQGEKRKEMDDEKSGEGTTKSNKKPIAVETPFMQEGSCLKASKFLTRCRDCTIRKEEVAPMDEVCRFAEFRKIVRKLATNGPKGFFVQAFGFCDPQTDPEQSDIDIWMPNPENPPKELPLTVCKQLISQLGDQVCGMVQEENNALKIEASFEDKNLPIGWKRLVEGVREMCDVCATTLFNYHWICESCGFVACLACFKSRMEGVRKIKGKDQAYSAKLEKKDEYNWISCSKGELHFPSKMQLTQILPCDVLNDFNKLIHKVRHSWNIPQLCGCPEAIEYSNRETHKEELDVNAKPQLIAKPVTALWECMKSIKKTKKVESSSDESDDESAAIDAVLNNMKKKQPSSPRVADQVTTTTPIDLTKKNVVVEVKPEANLKNNASQIESNAGVPAQELKHYVRTQDKSYYHRAQVSALVSSVVNTSQQFPGLRHSWLCDGTLLKLDDPDHPSNVEIFQEVWRRGQPVVVSNVGQKLNKSIWTPESFIEDYGIETSDLVNCLTGNVLLNQKIQDFWEGFIDVKKRMRDSNGIPMLLKLKDWPPAEDFAKFSPNRFVDLMQALPLKEYTHREGKLNLAARLPKSFMRPDLGPKMYIAYGHGDHLDKGTTVLHMDISDAVNCMVYVGISKNCDPRHNASVIKAVEESDCDFKMIERVTIKKELPGALWHIYRPWEADKIRDLLNKVSVENGKSIEPNHDPIHDQVMYLDRKLRRRLKEEYNVTGFPIVQCEGDLVFIPAGAPHQVRNLHNCIKIAEDFVSPENISHCFQLKEEFRNLSDTHSNHEDKLQIKNIVYHAVKDAMSVLMNEKP